VLAQSVAEPTEAAIAVRQHVDQAAGRIVAEGFAQPRHERRHLPAVTPHRDDDLFERRRCTVAPARLVAHPDVA
jgi:hypothetical protein